MNIRPLWPPLFTGWSQAMTKKILTGALAALALTATLAASANDAQARPRWGFLP